MYIVVWMDSFQVDFGTFYEMYPDVAAAKAAVKEYVIDSHGEEFANALDEWIGQDGDTTIFIENSEYRIEEVRMLTQQQGEGLSW